MKKICLITLMIFTALLGKSQDEKLEGIIHQLKTFYQYNPGEKVFLTTNKEVFKPGETVWFNALVKCYTSPDILNLTPSLTIRLYSEDGSVLLFDNYKIVNGRSEGDFILPPVLEPGRYFIASYTEVANQEDDVFLKMIFIDPKDEDEVQVEPKMLPAILISGKVNNLDFLLSDISGEPSKSDRVKYELYENKTLIDDGKLKTEKDGSLKVSLNIPDKKFDGPLILSLTNNNGKLDYSKSFHVDAEKLKVRFFAEGSNFVAGIPQKIGFSVTNGIGQSVAIDGELRDSQGNKLSQVQTMVPGYGMFPFIGDESKSYQLYITSELGNGQYFKLPEFKSEDVSFSIQRSGPEFLEVSVLFPDKAKHQIYLLGTRGDQVFLASEMDVNGGLRAKISKENFPQGLSLLSVFSTEGKLLGKRLIFLDKEQGLNVDIKASDEQVKTGEGFNLKIDVKSRNGNMVNSKLSASISVDNENLKGLSELESCFVLSAELENKIPLDELFKTTTNIESSLNYLLISEQYKNFNWEDVLQFDPEKVGENEGGIGGYVYNTDMLPVKNAKVSLVNSKNLQILTKPTDNKGYFFFAGLDPAGISDYVATAIDVNGQENLTIEFSKSFDEKLATHVEEMARFLAFIEQPQVSFDFVRENRLLFKSVQRKTIENKMEPAYKSYLQTATSLLDVVRMIKPYDLMNGKIVFKGTLNSFNAQDGALIVLDGQQMGTTSSILATISPRDVETINISTNPMDIQKYTGLNSIGIIEITTKRGEYAEKEVVENANKYENGFRVPKDFMLSRIENEEMSSTTLYWAPVINLDASGSLSLEVPGSAVAGDFLIEVEAIDEDGNVGKARKTIRVVN